MDKAAYLEFVVEIIRRSEPQQGFEVLQRQWLVERIFGWMTRWKRLARDYERRIDVSTAMITSQWPGSSCAEMLSREFPNGLLATLIVYCYVPHFLGFEFD